MTGDRKDRSISVLSQALKQSPVIEVNKHLLFLSVLICFKLMKPVDGVGG